MWSDRETTIDLLNVEHLVTAITGTVTRGHLRPLTLGVFGDWGSGKSSVISMAKQRVEQDHPNILCVYFNGWLFEGYEDAKAAILGTILDELADKRKAKEKARD
jgi:predicted KAP-like P-loop ATPase